jgi:hypothetical protein
VSVLIGGAWPCCAVFYSSAKAAAEANRTRFEGVGIEMGRDQDMTGGVRPGGGVVERSFKQYVAGMPSSRNVKLSSLNSELSLHLPWPSHNPWPPRP